MLLEVDGAGRIAVLPDDTPLPNGAYTTLRTYDTRRVLRLGQHVARLTESVALQGSAAALSEPRLRAGLAAAFDRVVRHPTRVRVTFAPPRLFVALAPFEPLPATLYAAGVACATVPLRRANPHAKDTRFLVAADAARARLPAGVHEGLMVDDADGAILEGLSSNFFGVVGGELRTEGERVLAGVTRSLVLELAQGLLPVRFVPVHRHELASMSEAFITSASRGVLPVVGVDDGPVGDGRPGPITRQLMDRLADLVQREATDVSA